MDHSALFAFGLVVATLLLIVLRLGLLLHELSNRLSVLEIDTKSRAEYNWRSMMR